MDVLILRTLCGEQMHGYAVSQKIRQRSEGVLQLDDAALYQALHRLEGKDWIESEWGRSENNRRAKYYRLTSVGKMQLRQGKDSWRRYAEAVSKVLDPA
ncbi:MAG: PadR family transcriptional regulator [Acidobacteriota bacterium]